MEKLITEHIMLQNSQSDNDTTFFTIKKENIIDKMTFLSFLYMLGSEIIKL
jgi:hypothetical protein